PDHKPCRNSRPTTVAVQRRDLAVDEVPVDLARELHQLVPHVDDLVQPRAKQITRFYRLVLLRPHRFPPIRRPNHASRFEGILKMKLQAFRVSDPETLQSQLDQTARKRLSVDGLEVLPGRLPPMTLRHFDAGSGRRPPHQSRTGIPTPCAIPPSAPRKGCRATQRSLRR